MILPCIIRRVQVTASILEAEQCQNYPSWLKGKLIQWRNSYSDEREDTAWRVAMGTSFPLLPLQLRETLLNWGSLFSPSPIYGICCYHYYHFLDNNKYAWKQSQVGRESSSFFMLYRVFIVFHKKGMKKRNIYAMIIICYNSEIW